MLQLKPFFMYTVYAVKFYSKALPNSFFRYTGKQTPAYEVSLGDFRACATDTTHSKSFDMTTDIPLIAQARPTTILPVIHFD